MTVLWVNQQFFFPNDGDKLEIESGLKKGYCITYNGNKIKMYHPPTIIQNLRMTIFSPFLEERIVFHPP